MNIRYSYHCAANIVLYERIGYGTLAKNGIKGYDFDMFCLRHNSFAFAFMKTITFKSDSLEKIEQLIRVAHEMGIDEVLTHKLDEEEPPHTPIVGEAEMDAWLTKENGEKLTAEEVEEVVNLHINKLEQH